MSKFGKVTAQVTRGDQDTFAPQETSDQDGSSASAGRHTAKRGAATLRGVGQTDVGRVREHNEDVIAVEPTLGLYGVFDGMGGASSGDVAAATARDVVVKFIKQRALDDARTSARDLVAHALRAASAAVFHMAAAQPERHGMGTTGVVCLADQHGHALIGHVGDSRAYLWRDAVLTQLTRDHTVVEELVLRGALSPADAERHPYKNVLSRNLGARPDPHVDVVEIDIEPGDRILLCSDGLTGFAENETIQYILASADAPETAAQQLIALALAGGGGDNVSVVVIESATAAPPETNTQIVRTSGAIAWWQLRNAFFASALTRGFAETPLCEGLSEASVVERFLLPFAQAIFADLERSSANHVWAFGQKVALTWLAQTGDWPTLRAANDMLAEAATAQAETLATNDRNLGYLLHVALTRALTVFELAMGGVLADRLRAVEHELIALAQQRAIAEHHRAASANERARSAPPGATTIAEPIAPQAESSLQFTEQATVPFARDSLANFHHQFAPEHVTAIRSVVAAAKQQATGLTTTTEVLTYVEQISAEADPADVAPLYARELYGIRALDEGGIAPLYDALDRAQQHLITATHSMHGAAAAQVAAMRVLLNAHQLLVTACTSLVLEATAPSGERLLHSQRETQQLRRQLESLEQQRAALERELAVSTLA